MPGTTARNLTLAEAAGMICRTKSPSADGLALVVRELEVGSLKGKRKGADQWVVSTEDVAEYLADRAMLTRTRSAQVRGSAAAKALIRASAATRGSSELHHVYRNIFKDYFLAVMLRRKVGRASQAFARMVLAGQVFVLLCMTWGAFAAMRQTVLSPPSPERQAVETWIAQQTNEYSIQRWFPTQAPPDDDDDFVIVRVQYRYSTSRGKSVESDRTFRVEGNKATPDDGDD